MTEEERQSIFQRIRERALDTSKIDPNFEIPGDPWANDSLAKVVNTKEKAELFMKMFEWAKEKANNK